MITRADELIRPGTSSLLADFDICWRHIWKEISHATNDDAIALSSHSYPLPSHLNGLIYSSQARTYSSSANKKDCNLQ